MNAYDVLFLISAALVFVVLTLGAITHRVRFGSFMPKPETMEMSFTEILQKMK